MLSSGFINTVQKHQADNLEKPIPITPRKLRHGGHLHKKLSTYVPSSSDPTESWLTDSTKFDYHKQSGCIHVCLRILEEKTEN